MISDYEDILELPRPVSQRYAPMSLGDRAAQFSPFAALTGYESAVAETARQTEEKIEMGPDARMELDQTLSQLRAMLPEGPQVRVTYFVSDERKSGGSYRTAEGTVNRLDGVHQWLQLSGGDRVPFEDILFLEVAAEKIFPASC